jgi:hypothetical protein
MAASERQCSEKQQQTLLNLLTESLGIAAREKQRRPGGKPEDSKVTQTAREYEPYP